MIITYLNYCYKLVYEIIDLCIILLSIIVLIVSLLGYSKINVNDRLIANFDHGWDQHFISEIYEGRGFCKQNSEYLIQDAWGGTVEGCDCRGLVNDYIPWNKHNKTIREACSLNMTVGGCKNVPPINRIPYTKWRQVSLCAKRVTGMSYLQHLANSSSSSYSHCANGTKQCGILDTVGNKLCVLLNDQCPINKIIISAEIPPDEYKFKSIMISDKLYLYYTNEAVNSSVYLDVKISEGDPCLDSLEKNARKRPYTLERDYEVFCRTSLNGTRFDTRYTIMDTETKGQLFKDNDISSLLANLPGYPYDDFKGEVGMYSRPYVGWKKQCIEDESLNPGKMKTIPELVKAIRQRKMICMIISVVIVMYCISTIFLKFKYSDTPLVFNLIETGFLIISLFLFLYSYSNYKRINFFSKLEEFNCSDEITNRIFKDFVMKVLPHLGYELSLCIISMICFSIYPLIFVINLIFFFYEKMREREQPDYYSYA